MSGKMTVVDLFSGIGGFSLGLESTGYFSTVAFCEIEKYPRSILRKHWPDVPIFQDVRKLHAEDLPCLPDVITGGYPCQPFSLAGKRRGKEDDRHLWPEIIRLIRELAAAGKSPLGVCLRMLLGTSAWASTRCLLTWKEKTTPAGRLLFRLVPSTPRTEGTGSGLWPTPTIQESKNSTLPPSQINRDNIAGAILRGMLPTPHASCSTGAGRQGRTGGMNLQTAVKMLPTPTVSGKHNRSSIKKSWDGLAIAVNGRLNDQFVRQMMGYPEGWLD